MSNKIPNYKILEIEEKLNKMRPTVYPTRRKYYTLRKEYVYKVKYWNEKLEKTWNQIK